MRASKFPQNVVMRELWGTFIRGTKSIGLLLCVLAAPTFTGCCACGSIVSKIEVDVKAGDLDQSNLILVKEFDTGIGLADQKGNPPKVIAKYLVGRLCYHGYHARAHSPDLETHNALIIDGVITDFDRGSDLVRFLVGPWTALLGPADLLAAHAKATVKIHRESAPASPIAQFQIEAFDGAIGAGSEGCLEGGVIRAIVNYLNKRVGGDLPVGTAVSCPSYIER